MSIKEMKKYLRSKHVYIGYPERPAWFNLADKRTKENYRKAYNEMVKALFYKKQEVKK